MKDIGSNSLSGKQKNTLLIKKMCGVGIFAALAFITTFVCKLIPNVAGFLSIDAKDAVIAIASFVYGPVVAPIISIIVAFIEFITISETGIWGLIMNFASSATFSLVASLIYKYRKSFNGAIIGFAVATVATTGIMLLLNPIIVPLYTGAPRQAVIDMLPTILLPFNFAKTLMNSSVAILLYKPVISAMRSARLVPKSEHKVEFNKTLLFTLIIGGVSLFAALAILIVIW
ncbi:MAG: ECF transporter S component [Clostridia bacterium]|nr:ECF transporter S component [Clostridia bacterium]